MNKAIRVTLKRTTGLAALSALAVLSAARSASAAGMLADFNGDGKTDFAVWTPSTGTWQWKTSPTNATQTRHLGAQGDIPLVADFDGDGKNDLTVWRPSNGTWYYISSSSNIEVSQQWGVSTDVPVPADYDGDGKTDFAVWRPSEGNWYVIPSRTGVPYVSQWGQPGDVPVPADFDGDGKADEAIWRANDGGWYVIPSNGGAAYRVVWGEPGDIPVPLDRNGDGKADFIIFRKGQWWIAYNVTFTAEIVNWGVATDTPLMGGDFDADGKRELVVYRPGTSSVFWALTANNSTSITSTLGTSTDLPVPRILDTGKVILSMPGDSSDLSNLGVASWQWSTDTNALSAVLTGFDAAGNNLGNVTVQLAPPFTPSTSGAPVTVTMNVAGGTATMKINTAEADCAAEPDVGLLCNVTVTGSIANQPYTITYQSDGKGNIINDAINVAEVKAGKNKRIHLALNITPGVVAKVLPSLLNAFCLSCIGSDIAKIAKVAAKWTESGTVKLVAKVGQLLSGTSTAACIFQATILATELVGCGTAAAVDVPAAGTVTPAAVVACGSATVSLYTFKQNCNK